MGQVLTALTDAQRRAAEHRLAAEQLLEQARSLEVRLAQQTEQARAANEHAAAQRLATAAEKAGNLERAAAEDAQACGVRHQRSLRERNQAETDAGTARAALE